jgi:tetratricopeptide (TPR) repeat protein
MTLTATASRFLGKQILVGTLAILAGTFLAATVAPHAALAVDDETEGKKRFKRGQELYKAEKYLEAAHEFEAGYAAAPRSLFLMNIGHSYRRAGEFAKSKRAYQLLLQLEPTLPERADIEALVRSIDDAIAASPAPAPRSPAADPPSPTPPATAAPAHDPGPEAAPPPRRPVLPTLQTPPSEPAQVFVDTPASSSDSAESSSILRKPWFWVAMGAIVAGGVTILVVSLSQGQKCPGTICFKEAQR